MTPQPITQRSAALARAVAPVDELFVSTNIRVGRSPDIANFVFGNPHDMPLPDFVDALRRAAVPLSPDWFAYTQSDPEACEVVAASLREWRGLPFRAEDITMTNGAFGALAVALMALIEPEDEVIVNLPPWFHYDTVIINAAGVPIHVRVDPASFDLDVDAISAAITSRTRAIIVNTPNNPTGRIYPPEILERLSVILDEASRRNGRPIYILSDEPYSRIIFDDRPFFSPTAYYSNTLLIYSYGKVLLTPGQRIGYIALAPTMPDRENVMWSITVAQTGTGWAFPNALLQYALTDLEKLSIDIGHLQEKRDRLVAALRGLGYETHVPEGTFYLLPKSPLRDDVAFTELLAEDGVLVLPGSFCELPGYFRISLTASDEMINRALPGFKAAIERAARQQQGRLLADKGADT